MYGIKKYNRDKALIIYNIMTMIYSLDMWNFYSSDYSRLCKLLIDDEPNRIKNNEIRSKTIGG